MPLNEPLWVARPSWSSYFGQLLLGPVLLVAILMAAGKFWQAGLRQPLFWLACVLVLLIPALIAVTRRASLVLRIFPDRLMLETGLLAKNVLEIYIADVRTIEIHQSLSQRMLNIGDISIDTAGPADDELTARNIPDPIYLRDLVQDLRRKTEVKAD